MLGPAAVCARWRLGDGAVLTIAANLGEDQVSVENLGGRVIFATSDDVARRAQGGTLDGYSTVALLEKVDE